MVNCINYLALFTLENVNGFILELNFIYRRPYYCELIEIFFKFANCFRSLGTHSYLHQHSCKTKIKYTTLPHIFYCALFKYILDV